MIFFPCFLFYLFLFFFVLYFFLLFSLSNSFSIFLLFFPTSLLLVLISSSSSFLFSYFSNLCSTFYFSFFSIIFILFFFNYFHYFFFLFFIANIFHILLHPLLLSLICLQYFIFSFSFYRPLVSFNLFSNICNSSSSFLFFISFFLRILSHRLSILLSTICFSSFFLLQTHIYVELK